jgi:ABC-2 type transport system ATP-binding protein
MSRPGRASARNVVAAVVRSRGRRQESTDSDQWRLEPAQPPTPPPWRAIQAPAGFGPGAGATGAPLGGADAIPADWDRGHRLQVMATAPATEPPAVADSADQAASVLLDDVGYEGGGRALRRLSLRVEPGQVHGVLGPAGAGKSALLGLVSGGLLPASGRVVVLGRDTRTGAAEVRRAVATVGPGSCGLDPERTPGQNLEQLARRLRLDPEAATLTVARLVEWLGLGRWSATPVGDLPAGAAQRLRVAAALLTDPPVLLLDDPAAGLGPAARADLLALIRELRDERRTILLATEDLDEAAGACDQVTSLDGGRVLAATSAGVLRGLVGRRRRIEADAVPGHLLERLRRVRGVDEVAGRSGGPVRVHVHGDPAALEVLWLLLGNGVANVRTALPRLDEIIGHLVAPRPA